MPSRQTISVFQHHTDIRDRVHQMFAQMPAVVDVTDIGGASIAWHVNDDGFIVRSFAGPTYLFAITLKEWAVRKIWRMSGADAVDQFLDIFSGWSCPSRPYLGWRSGAVVGPLVTKPPPTRGGQAMTIPAGGRVGTRLAGGQDELSRMIAVIIETLPGVVRCLDFATTVFASPLRLLRLKPTDRAPVWLTDATVDKPAVVIAAPTARGQAVLTAIDLRSGRIKGSLIGTRAQIKALTREQDMNFTGDVATGATQPPPKPPKGWPPKNSEVPDLAAHILVEYSRLVLARLGAPAVQPRSSTGGRRIGKSTHSRTRG